MTRAPSCYSSARARGGQVWHEARHAQRLARDARMLGLGDVDQDAVLALLRQHAAPTARGPDLKIRIDAAADPQRGMRLSATASPLGDDAPTWTCVGARAVHPGPSPFSSAKCGDRTFFDAALAAAREAGADEALLFDAAGRLVEGTRSNLIVVRSDGSLATPALRCGAQAGIARGLLLERIAALRETEIARDELAAAREILATNAVRGVRPVIALDGNPVGDGRPGPWAARLAAAIEDA